MSCRDCGARCEYCEPMREHRFCVCGCGESLRGRRSQTRFATQNCQKRFYYHNGYPGTRKAQQPRKQQLAPQRVHTNA